MNLKSATDTRLALTVDNHRMLVAEAARAAGRSQDIIDDCLEELRLRRLVYRSEIRQELTS